MTERHFPDDHEIDQWTSSYVYDGSNANPVVDQLKAATADSVNRFRANAAGMVAAGLADRHFEVPDPDRSKIRGAVRQLMVAMSAGVFPLCQHVQHIRPQILLCDPPVVVCRGCFASRQAVIETLGHRWNHQCDRCGVHAGMLTPVSIGWLGKRRKQWHGSYRTIKEAQTERTKMLAAVNGGTYVPKTRQTVGEFVDEWLAAIKPTVREATRYSYARNLRLHVVPVIGSAPLAVVDAGTLNTLYAALLADGRKDHAGGGLVAADRALHPYDPSPGVQGRREVGEVGPESCRRRRPTQGGGG
jgi:hypothetical protein